MYLFGNKMKENNIQRTAQLWCITMSQFKTSTVHCSKKYFKSNSSWNHLVHLPSQNEIHECIINSAVCMYSNSIFIIILNIKYDDKNINMQLCVLLYELDNNNDNLLNIFQSQNSTGQQIMYYIIYNRIFTNVQPENRHIFIYLVHCKLQYVAATSQKKWNKLFVNNTNEQ